MNFTYTKTLDDYRAEGYIMALFDLTNKGLITVDAAAEEAGTGICEFWKNVGKIL